MPRTTIQIPFQKDSNQVHEAVKSVLLQNGYREVTYGDEMVWKKGTGFLTAMQYIKVAYQGHILVVSGWTRVGLGQYGFKEQALDGMVAVIPKTAVKKVMTQIQTIITAM